ncbi:MAG: UvrD-helicase domain-containing protein, partial [Mollicutes bacterium]|nr:UvrD-helicase domain-containing protein [Mollicutes bacterium]
MGLFSKNEAKEFKALSAYDSFLSNLLSADSYLSRKMFSARFDELGDIYQKLFLMQKENVLGEWCKKNSVDFKKFKRLMDQYASTNEVVEKHNDDYVKRHLKEDKAYLDDVLKKDDPKIRLDEEQRKVVLADEDYTLVIAGAGSGKTTTIEAKV